MENSNLLFRRQFIFSSVEFKPLARWTVKHLNVHNKNFTISCHPDLALTYKEGKLKVYLLGYIINPFNPNESDQDIVNEMSGYESYEEVLKRTDYLNGRYVLIIIDNGRLYVLNDATASKQVFYHIKDQEVWIASTPNIILEYKKLQPSTNEELFDYLNSKKYRTLNSAWFGSETPYQDLFSLYPNHYIDVLDNSIHRFWPIVKKEKLPIKDSIDYIAKILRGTIEGAAKRYKLHNSLTGGWDSRMILSSAKNVYNEIDYYTLKDLNRYKKNMWDLILPQRISNKYELKYNLIEFGKGAVEEEFIDTLKKNSVFNREIFSEVYYNYIKQGFEDRMNVTGIMGDQILRVFYRFKGDISSEKFSERFKGDEFPYIAKSIEKYFAYLKPTAEKFNYHIIDWFNWEFYFANWGGISATEHDIARDELRMFNCRELLSTFMLIDEKYRYRDNPKAHRLIVKRNWSELLHFNVEPSNIQHRNLKKTLRFFHIEQIVEKLYNSAKVK